MLMYYNRLKKRIAFPVRVLVSGHGIIVDAVAVIMFVNAFVICVRSQVVVYNTMSKLIANFVCADAQSRFIVG
jgi:hypothetical protein